MGFNMNRRTNSEQSSGTGQNYVYNPSPSSNNDSNKPPSKLSTIGGWILVVFGLLIALIPDPFGFLFVALGCFFTLKGTFNQKPIYKRKRVYICLVLCALITFSSASIPKITSLSLDCGSTIELDLKETSTIPVLFSEEGANTDKIEFVSSDQNILTFTSKQTGNSLTGIITPKAEGTAEIMISAGNVESTPVTVTIIDSERIAAEEAARKAAEEAARKAAEEEAARKAAEEEAARKAAEEEAARKAAEEEAAKKAAEEEAAKKAAEEAAQQQAAEEAEQQAAAQQPQEQMVWVPKSGSKYHSSSSCSGMDGPRQIPISQAISRGYEPCKRCY